MFRHLLLLGHLLILGGVPVTTLSGQPAAAVQVRGAMRNVMWKGELGGVINLDTLDREGLYGVGPVAGLRGELLIMNGTIYQASVVTETRMQVDSVAGAQAPFFVYAQQAHWLEVSLPDSITSMETLEKYLDQVTVGLPRPFVFKLQGTLDSALIHVVNLAPGSIVRSPTEAHRGQQDYPLQQVPVDVIGFFSTEHQGVFTHHDSYLHLHAITANRKLMGHLDFAAFSPGALQLFLPTY